MQTTFTLLISLQFLIILLHDPVEVRGWSHTGQAYVDRYWLIYCALTLISAVAMWYLPYFFGCSEAKIDEYQRLYAGTRQILPARGNNPRPNLLHVIFHLVFVATLSLALLIYIHPL